MATQAGSGTLDGLRVLDMSQVMAGPLAGQVLADLGADVIKVERPGRGDDTREWAPPFVADPPATPLDESVYFWTCNRGKRSVVADIASPEGQALVARLVATSDVLIENYKVGTQAKYGLDYQTLSAAYPRLVYCSITGNPDDAPGGGPRKAGIAVADQMTALYADVAIMAALRERERSGLGQHIDMSLLDVQVAGLNNLGLGYLAIGRVPPRAGNRLATVYPSDSFRCADGDLMIIVGNDAQFRAFCAALGMPGVWRMHASRGMPTVSAMPMPWHC